MCNSTQTQSQIDIITPRNGNHRKGFNVLYDMKFKKNGVVIVQLNHLKIKEIISKFSELVKEHNNLDLNISTQIIYNLHSRPNMVKKLIKDLCEVSKSDDEFQPKKKEYKPRGEVKRKYTKKKKPESTQ